MYCSDRVYQRLEIAQAELKFVPEYHSPAEIDDFEKKLEQRYEAEYAKARAAAQGAEEPVRAFHVAISRELANPEAPRLSADEVRWMQNERALLMCDAAYFLTRYYWILNDEGIKQKFRFRSGQKIFFNCVSEIESMSLAIEILLAKARQLGMTTVVAGLLLIKAMFSHGVSAVTASADPGKTREMVRKILMAYDNLPWWVRPLYTKRAEGDKGYLRFGTMDSGIIFQHGNQTNPIAMGTTVIGYHLSEVSSYPDAEDLIDVGLFKAVHPSPRVFGVLESTCKGDTGWWHDNYWDAKKGWSVGESRLMALFLPFFCAEDMYPNATERRGHPVPQDWKPMHETRQMMAESVLYVGSNPVLAKVLARDGKQWEMSREQAWYWEWNFKAARSKGNEKTWYQEMPHTDRAAFQGSFDNVFGREVIAEVFSRRETAYHVYGIVGQSIEERHEPDVEEVDWSEPRVAVKYDSRRGETYRWEFVPLQWREPFRQLEDIRDDESHMGKLFVWLEPQIGYDYSIGVDTSSGIGSDNTVVTVSRRARNPQEPDVQAAEFRSNKVSHVEAFAWVLAIAAYYGRHMGQAGVIYREPYVAIEQIAAVGDTCQLQMSKMGYSRFHQMIRYDSRPKDMKKQKAHKRGWYTNTWSRPMLTDGFVILVQNGWYVVNSPYTIWECDHWEVHITAGGKEKFEHSSEATDDGVFANAMAAFCPNDLKAMAERTAKRWMGPEKGMKGPKLDIVVPKAGLCVPVSAYAGEDVRRYRV